MDAAHIFRQGLGTVPPRQNQPYTHPRRPQLSNDELSDGDGSGQRVAHTLTACCRCRQRKTRCDPTLPRCLPCERSGSTCEYLDAAKGRKINRHYVIRLQERVRALEAELSQYTDEEGDYPRTNEDMVRPGGMVRLNASDETPRYLGPSSGIAMTRLLMEEAKRYTETNRISDIIPELRAKRQARMQSIVMTGQSGRKSYPMQSERPAEQLPTRAIADKLLEVFYQKAQTIWPVLHEQTLHKDFEAVYNGDNDSYKNFVVRMVIAISLQKLDTQYAGLADSYYVAAMQHFTDVIRPKDLKTLQCLVLVGMYSMLTPTRTPVYYVLGLATRICHQEGLTEESTIATGENLDPLTVDMRRRLVWIVAGMELGLSHSMGRPSSFAKGDDRLDVGFFSTVDDEHISENGIQSAPPSPRKLVAVHFYKLRIYQAEIRRSLYEKKRTVPANDSHPWYEDMEKRMQEWVDSAPEHFSWCKPWFTSRYHQMRIFLYRPSPQVPKPTARGAKICFESAAAVINISFTQLAQSAEDVTWVFVLVLNMALNTVLWATSYPDVRQEHAKEEVEDLVDKSLSMLEQSAERWPGSASASQLYAVLSKACLQSYESRTASEQPSENSFATPLSIMDSHSSPEGFSAPPSTQPLQYIDPPSFGYVFDSPPESMNNYAFDPNYPPPQPTFRSNSIFRNPGSDPHGRRFSYFPPDFNNPGDISLDEATPPTATPDRSFTSPPDSVTTQLPTPPESGPLAGMSITTPNSVASPPSIQPLSNSRSSPGPQGHPLQNSVSPPQKPVPPQPQPPQRAPTFAVAPSSQPAPQQRPLPPAPATIADWFSPPPPFISPLHWGSVNNYYFNDTMAGPPSAFGEPAGPGMGLQSLGVAPDTMADLTYVPGRQGSLTQSQQLELMNVLETEGVGDIDAFLSGGNTMIANRWF